MERIKLNPNVKTTKLTNIKRNQKIAKTFDIEIENSHYYILDNGLVSHNTISTIAETSSGIEPVFALSYMRKVEQLNKQYDIMYISDPIFEDYLTTNYDDKTKEKILKHVAENKGSCQTCDLITEEIRRIFVTAGDITPKEHLDILEVCANATSLSVSKTINLPSSITKEEMGDVFLDAYKRGIIGVTVYRDNCREGILVHEEGRKINRPTEIIYQSAPKRPKELPCDIHRINAMVKNDDGTKTQEKFIIFVGLLNNKPFEFFVGKIEDISLPKNITDGYIIKVKSGQYAFKYDDEIIIANINKAFHSDSYATYARLISALLRHGGHPKYVIDQLNKCPGTIVDFSKTAIRMLKKYIPDGEEGNICECGTKKIYYGGCLECPSCGLGDCG